MHIPKQFKLSGKLHKVQRVSRMRKRRTMGDFDPYMRVLQIAASSNVSGRVFKHEEVCDTFWHEAVHAILFDMEHFLARNEEFVTQFSRRLNELVHTAEL